MNNSNKHLLTGAIAFACLFAGMSGASAQSATFIFNDGSGTPNAGTYTAGSSFTFSINLAFTPGGTISNLEGLSYWFQQISPSGSPFNFAITLRDVTGSQFTDLQTPSPSYPLQLNPSEHQDLGALLASGVTAKGAGTYFIANITVSIDPSALAGTYTIGNTTTGGQTSVITDSAGHTFAIPEADYFITVVPIPEPGTWLAAALSFTAILFAQRHRVLRLVARPHKRVAQSC